MLTPVSSINGRLARTSRTRTSCLAAGDEGSQGGVGTRAFWPESEVVTEGVAAAFACAEASSAAYMLFAAVVDGCALVWPKSPSRKPLLIVMGVARPIFRRGALTIC